MPQDLLISGGRVLDPANGVDLDGASVLVRDGRIQRVGLGLSAEGTPVIDARGLVVTPGFVDLHTHLREPGFEHKETIASGAGAAARGGFTTVCAMPNTEPAMDRPEVIELVLRRARETAAVRVLPIGCVSEGRAGKTLAGLAALAAAGCVAFSDDGAPVGDDALIRAALRAAKELGLAVIDHCEDPALAGGSMNAGALAARLGVKGIPAQSEANAIARDIALARETGAHVHIAHVSTALGVDLVRRARAEGLGVTAEVTPHHLTLTEDAVIARRLSPARPYDTNAKMYPPLRPAADVAACVEGLRDGTIDAIATDHAPHAEQDKLCDFEAAAFGMVGLETALALILTRARSLSFERVIEALTIGPVRALSLDRYVTGIGSLSPGAPADITIIDPDAEWTVDPRDSASKGKNTPLTGMTLRGRIVVTIFGGKVVHQLQGVSA